MHTTDILLPILQAPLPFRLIDAKTSGKISACKGLGIITISENSTIAELEQQCLDYSEYDDNPAFCFYLPPIEQNNIAHQQEADHIYRQLELPPQPVQRPESFGELLSHAITKRPRLIGFVQGIPDQETIDLIHHEGVSCFAICRSASEALAAYAMNIDSIVLQGIEAGGIHSRFPNLLDEPMQPCLSLLAQVRNLIDIPIILWGDFPQGNDIVAALIAGAEAVMTDRPWLGCADVPLTHEQRTQILHTNETQSQITTTFSRLPMRHLSNPLTQDVISQYHDRLWVFEEIFQTHPEWKPLSVSPTPVSPYDSIEALCQNYTETINQYLS